MADDLRSPLDFLNTLDGEALDERLAQFADDDLAAILDAAHLRAHGGQVPPGGDWTTWLILAGRGFGKTFAGAAWIDERARSVRGARIALVGATLNDARSVMVEGDAGVLAVARERRCSSAASRARASCRCSISSRAFRSMCSCRRKCR